VPLNPHLLRGPGQHPQSSYHSLTAIHSNSVGCLCR